MRVTVYLVEADDVGVLQQLHDLHLSEDLFQVLLVQLGLIHYFYSHLETETREKKRWKEMNDGRKRDGEVVKRVSLKKETRQRKKAEKITVSRGGENAF